MKQKLLYKNEKSLFLISAIISIFIWAVLILGTFGVALFYCLIFYIFYLFAHSAMISYLKGTAVKVTPEQFPDIYAQLKHCCEELDITEIPATYLMHADRAFNAFATRFLGRNFVVLFSDVVDTLQDNPNSLIFYIGHELGHVHRKHLLWAPVLFPAMLLPILGAAYSRAREYTCDNYGFECCPDPKDAIFALAPLAAGANRWKTLKISHYTAQADTSGEFWMSFNELLSDYPWLVKRVSHLKAKTSGKVYKAPPRHFMAWMLAVFIPRTGMGANAGSVLIIAAIIGIMAAIAIPQYASYQQRANETLLIDMYRNSNE